MDQHALPLEWDAIIVGASFAGLAAATRLAGSGRVLMLDRRPVGEGQTSACATPVSVLDRLRALDAIEQVHTVIVIHTPDGQTSAVIPDLAYATFDYRTFCKLFRARSDATFVQAAVLGREGNTIVTTVGSFRAPVLIDASGWRSVASAGHKPTHLSVGIEVETPGTGEGLHLWLRPPEIDCGMAWVFPAGANYRVGVACYEGRGGLKTPLNTFFPASGLGPTHGGRLPSRLRRPVLDGVFRVGDAAGQCLPITGEGIRPALVFGEVVGGLAHEVLTGAREIEEARGAYEHFVSRRAPYYGFLAWLQDAMLATPRPLAATFVRLLAACYQSGPGLRSYRWAADPMLLGQSEWNITAEANSRVA